MNELFLQVFFSWNPSTIIATTVTLILIGLVCFNIIKYKKNNNSKNKKIAIILFCITLLFLVLFSIFYGIIVNNYANSFLFEANGI